MKIIDTHVHIGGERVGFFMTEEMVATMMDKYHIDYAVVSNADSAEMDHEQNLLPQQYTQEENLKRMIRFVRKHTDKITIAVWVKPYTQGLTKELQKMIEDNLDIISGIKLHPFHSNTSPVDKKCLPYLELADRLKLAVVSHTGGCEAASPIHLYEAAKMFPDIPFVMVHMGLGSDNTEALDLLGKADNLYGDTTWVKMSTTMEAIRRYGNRKIMFGSDAPIDGIDTYLCNKYGDRSLYQDYFNVLPQLISKEDYEMLMYKNAEKIFKLNIV
ncbi:MAG: amidohydrolase family protein [Lachnospiraceae bacterium]|nr:amidohydrolase family protein [Lachnospiraceae bacterium]